MTDEEIKDIISKVEGINGMTVNERLSVSGLMDEYDKVKWSDKPKAKRILELLDVDEPSINKIIKTSTTKKQIFYSDYTYFKFFRLSNICIHRLEKKT